MPQVAWQWKRFAELTPAELYALLAARAEVFVVEQRCAFQDLDDNKKPCNVRVRIGILLTCLITTKP